MREGPRRHQGEHRRGGARVRLSLLALLLLASAAGASVGAQTGAEPVLRVGTKVAVPFAMKQPDGSWGGLSVALWREIAAELGVRTEFVETDLEGLLSGLAEGRLDVSVAALTVTSEREEAVDFSHPFHTSGLGIAVPTSGGRESTSLLRAIFSSAFLKVVAGLAVVLVIAGGLVWFFERKRNPEEFGGPGSRGLWSGFWWSAVTMTTVGYGDKAPKTLGGRVVGLVWMFASIIMISGFTAQIASTLTLSRLEGAIQGPDDLDKVQRVATVAGSTSEEWLKRNGIARRAYPDLGAALEATASGACGALVYDAPLLKYQALHDFAGRLAVLPSVFVRQDYAFALPVGSAWRKRINRRILERTATRDWQDTLREYLGD